MNSNTHDQASPLKDDDQLMAGDGPEEETPLMEDVGPDMGADGERKCA